MPVLAGTQLRPPTGIRAIPARLGGAPYMMEGGEAPNLLNAGPSSSTPTRAAFYAALVGSLVLCAGFVAWTQLRLSGFVVADDLAMTGTPILAGVLCMRRGQREVSARRFWRLLGASYLSYALGMI